MLLLPNNKKLTLHSISWIFVFYAWRLLQGTAALQGFVVFLCAVTVKDVLIELIKNVSIKTENDELNTRCPPLCVQERDKRTVSDGTKKLKCRVCRNTVSEDKVKLVSGSHCISNTKRIL